MVFENGLKTLILAGVGLTLVSLFAKPVVNLLLLPINLLTYGLFRWVGSAVVLYVVTLLLKDFRIYSFDFVGMSSKWLDLPAMHFQGFAAFVAFSFVLSMISSVIYWLIK